MMGIIISDGVSFYFYNAPVFITLKIYFMTIEFHTPIGLVSEKMITSIRHDVMELAHIHKKITRAEVSLREDKKIDQAENKVCEIRLTIQGDNLFVRSRTQKFEESVKEAIKDLRKLVRGQVKHQDDLTDDVLSSVKV
jgi:hypothetical protein